MSDEEAAVAASVVPAATTAFSSADAKHKAESAVQSLSSIIPLLPPSLSSSANPALSLLHDPDVSSRVSALLRKPNSGAGDNHLCRWLYDTFQSGVPDLQLVVLRFLPAVAGVYLSRIPLRKPQSGFEAVLLALYAYETTSRAGQALTVTIPDLSHPSVYHDHDPRSSPAATTTAKNNATGLNLAVISPSLEPHGAVRSTRRARIVGVALELYYTKISQMPIKSKIELCEFCKIWAGQDGGVYKQYGIESERKPIKNIAEEEEEEEGEEEQEEPKIEEIISEVEVKKKEVKKLEGRIPLPWELQQPVLRILGHCLLGPNNCKEKELMEKASEACRCLYGRAMHDVNPKAILATGGLMRLITRLERNQFDDFDDFSNANNVISI